jgi:fatty acid amide hydrolase 2
MTAGLDWLSGLLDAGFKSRQLARANDLARRVADAVGGGVLLHPAFPTLAPRHHHTYGRPWLLMPSAIFNLAGVPVTEVPLGIDPRSGLPVGLQVAAPHGDDHLGIAVALALESALGGWRPPPGL